MPVINTIAGRKEELTAWRRHLHAHPELGFEERETADFIAAKLQDFGVDVVDRGLAKTGVVAVIHGRDGGKSGKMVALRADIDALPMTEENDFAHVSRHKGRMHACGHDGHTVMLLGAVQYLAETRNFEGSVVAIFQPAEEGGGGGKVMVEEGVFEKFPARTVWGLHNWPGLDVGRAVVHHGASMAAADMFDITITGHGGHAAMPHGARDPVTAAAALVSAAQVLVSREVDAHDGAVLSITQFHAGSAWNVIPDSATLGGTARYFRREVGAQLEKRLGEMAEQIAAAHGCKAAFAWQKGYPPTINHAAEAGRAGAVAGAVLGEDAVVFDAPPSMGAEDFSFMLEAKPGAYIWLGAGEAKAGGALHGARYDFNDELLPLGASYWVQLAESELGR